MGATLAAPKGAGKSYADAYIAGCRLADCDGLVTSGSSTPSDSSAIEMHMTEAIPSPTANQNDVQTACEILTTGCARLVEMLNDLRDAESVTPGHIQRVRQQIHRVRGGFSLLRPNLKVKRDLRAVSRVLADPREAIRRLGVWRSLALGSDPKLSAAISSLLDYQCSSPALSPPEAVVDWCVARVESAASQLQPEEAPAALEIEARLRALARKAKRYSLKLTKGGVDFHAARKALREWGAATAFVPRVSAAGESPDAVRLLAALRAVRDLCNFEVWLEDHGFSQPLAPELWDELRKSRKAAHKTAVSAAQAVFEG